jgi:hypothetical protein
MVMHQPPRNPARKQSPETHAASSLSHGLPTYDRTSRTGRGGDDRIGPDQFTMMRTHDSTDNVDAVPDDGFGSAPS